MDKVQHKYLRRRGLISEEKQMGSGGGSTDVIDTEGNLKLNVLCEKRGGIYCKLSELVELVPHRGQEIIESVTIIYNFLRPKIYDNRLKFHSLISGILESPTAVNSLRLIADYILKEQSHDSHSKSIVLDRLRREDIEMTDSEIENFIIQASTTTYSQYENSFIGQHFEMARTKLELKYRDRMDTTIYNIVVAVARKRMNLDEAVNDLFEAIKASYNPKTMLKADLFCVSSLYNEKGQEVIPQGSFVEVKKLDYLGDSYLSEFFAIYKRTDIPALAQKPQFILVYNNIINALYNKINGEWGQAVLKDIRNNFAGIIYDNNLFIPSKNIELYWSNRGRTSCKQLRLTIRYRVTDEATGYKYNPKEDVMNSRVYNVSERDKIIC